MVKYGLRPGTLKGALFRIFLEQGNNGLKVSDMAKSFPIFDLKLASTTEELECLICSMLSSEITLFEKISPTTYRLRINSILKKVEELQSDTEDFGAVDDGLSESDAYSSDEDSRCDAKDSTLIEVKKLNNKKNQNGLLNDYTEIDERHPSESWLLGLMEGEYSDLSIEEKLNVMVALIDLLREGSSIRMESVMLEDALIGAWTKSAHKLWVKWLRHTSSLQELMQIRTHSIRKVHENIDKTLKLYWHNLILLVRDNFNKKFMAVNPYFGKTIGDEGKYKDKNKKDILFNNEFSVLFYL